MPLPIIAALKGLAALPKLVDSVSALCDRLGSLEKQINEKQVMERKADKHKRNSAAIKRVLASKVGQGGGADKSPPI